MKVTTYYVSTEIGDGSDDFVENKIMECSNPQCNHPVVYAYPKFKIHIRVQDPTGTVTLTLFESDASKLLHKTANELMENQDEWDEGLFPDELDTLLGKKTRFQE